jgi:hypothetical protein
MVGGSSDRRLLRNGKWIQLAEAFEPAEVQPVLLCINVVVEREIP